MRAGEAVGEVAVAAPYAHEGIDRVQIVTRRLQRVVVTEHQRTISHRFLSAARYFGNVVIGVQLKLSLLLQSPAHSRLSTAAGAQLIKVKRVEVDQRNTQ
jgi:hypothetical protein